MQKGALLILKVSSEILFILKLKSLSCIQFFATPWTVACQAPPPMGFFRQEYWSGLSFLPFLLLLFHSSTEFSLLEFV